MVEWEYSKNIYKEKRQMKRLTSILALMLAGVMLICALPLSAGA